MMVNLHFLHSSEGIIFDTIQMGMLSRETYVVFIIQSVKTDTKALFMWHNSCVEGNTSH